MWASANICLIGPKLQNIPASFTLITAANYTFSVYFEKVSLYYALVTKYVLPGKLVPIKTPAHIWKCD